MTYAKLMRKLIFSRFTIKDREQGKLVEPTIEQLNSFYRLCVRTSNLLKTVELTRYDTRTQRIVVLIGETIQVEILTNGEIILQ